MPGIVGTPDARREAPRLGLVPHRLDHVGTRPDPHEALVDAGGCELGVFGEESVAGMDGVRARVPGRLEQGGDAQIALARVRWPDADGLVGAADVERVLVGRGVDRDAGQAELAACADDAERDLPPVRDEDLVHCETG